MADGGTPGDAGPAATQAQAPDADDVFRSSAIALRSSAVARSLSRFGRHARDIAAHAPVSITLAAVLLVVGLVTGTLWVSTEDKSWFTDIACGVPALRDGQWWTPLSCMVFGLTPAQLASIVALLLIVASWAEWRLGSVRTLVVMIVGQLAGILVTCLFAWGLSSDVIGGIGWDWPTQLSTVRDVGMTTGVVAAATAATATLRSPWRLRARLLLTAYVSLSILFEGTFADVCHLVAFVIMLVAGERLFSTTERGFAPRTRREIRLLSFTGLIVIAGSSILVWFFPGSGPLGPTDSGDSSVWVMWVHVAVIAVVAMALRRGRRWAWWVTVVFGSLNVVAVVLAVTLAAVADYAPEGGVTLGTSLLWLAEVGILVSGRFAFTVRGRSRISDGPGVDAVKQLLHTYGGGTMSWMTTWDNNQYLFDAPGDPSSVVTYQRRAGVLLALADPVCAPDQVAETTRAFTRFAESSGLVPCWFSIGTQTASIAREMGWRTVQIAEDSIVDLPDLQYKGKSWQHVRSALNKAKKEQITHRLTHLADESFAVRAQVQAISEEWVGDKGLPEMGFTLGGVDEALDPEVRVSLAVDADGSIHGVLSWLPVYGPENTIRGWTLDVMRRRTDGFGPVIEFLLGSAFMEFKGEGAEFVSLSGAPLASSDDSGDRTATDRLLDVLGAAMEPFYGFRSLHAFKKKFSPRYEGVYLAYRDEGDLPRIGVAISRAYLPDATPGQLARLAVSRDDGGH